MQNCNSANNSNYINKVKMSAPHNATETSKIATELLLTHAECVQILANACGTQLNLQIKKFKLVPLRCLNGFLGDYYDLYVIYNAAECGENDNLSDRRELKAFVKGIPQASMEPEKEAIFLKEATLYGTLLERLRKYSTVPWCPRCFYARDDLIVLEQLELRGYALSSNPVEYISDNNLKKVLRGLAMQHACCIALEQKENIFLGDAYPQLQLEITVSPKVPWYINGLQAIFAVIQKQLATETVEVKEKIAARLPSTIESVYNMTNRSSKYRNVLCHRDIWRGNIFYRENSTHMANEHDDDSALFVDYQTARYCPPAIDLIFTLFMNLETATSQEAREKEYLRYYYECLQQNLVANGFAVTDLPIPYAELLSSYEEFRPFGLFYRAIVTTILKVPREFVTAEYVHVSRTESVLKLMAELPEFKKCLEERVREIITFLAK